MTVKKYYKFKFKDRHVILAARPGTYDKVTIQTAFFHNGIGEYASPVTINPEVIFDIGAHIGAVSIYYSFIYPGARIYAFEPLPENYTLLKINAGLNSDRIIPVRKGLGNKSGYFTYRLSVNPQDFIGGFKNFNYGKGKTLKLPVVSVKKFIREKKIEKIDIIKIDTEGMEFDIIRDIPPGILKKTKIIIGECHGVKDLELFLYLSGSFNVGFNKKYSSKDFDFVAVNKEISK